jgi:hypothetical protein|tara:strand:- start:387 stop:629 length:243 start_codon:yes stop_codon:yes gene_type:complete
MIKKTKKIKQLETTGEIEIDINTIELEEMLIALGGVLFAGADIQEIDTPLLSRLEDLIIAEVLIRENNSIRLAPKGESIH